MNACHSAAAFHEQHVAAPEQLFGTLLTENSAAVDPRGNLKADPCGEVRLDGAGDDINRGALGRHDHMDAGSPRHLRKALHGSLDFLAGDQHQVGNLVNHHDDEGQWCQIQDLFFKDRAARLSVKSGLDTAGQHLALVPCLGHAFIVTGDVADIQLRHVAIAGFHLANGPFQRRHRLGRFGHHRAQQMRDAVIDRQFQHLGVNQDHPACFRGVAIEERQDHRVDAHRLAGASGARD